MRSLIEMGALIVELVHLWKCKKARLHDGENLVKQSDFELTQKLVKWQRLHLVMQLFDKIFPEMRKGWNIRYI